MQHTKIRYSYKPAVWRSCFFAVWWAVCSRCSWANHVHTISSPEELLEIRSSPYINARPVRYKIVCMQTSSWVINDNTKASFDKNNTDKNQCYKSDRKYKWNNELPHSWVLARSKNLVFKIDWLCYSAQHEQMFPVECGKY